MIPCDSHAESSDVGCALLLSVPTRKHDSTLQHFIHYRSRLLSNMQNNIIKTTAIKFTQLLISPSTVAPFSAGSPRHRYGIGDARKTPPDPPLQWGKRQKEFVWQTSKPERGRRPPVQMTTSTRSSRYKKSSSCSSQSTRSLGGSKPCWQMQDTSGSRT